MTAMRKLPSAPLAKLLSRHTTISKCAAKRPNMAAYYRRSSPRSDGCQLQSSEQLIRIDVDRHGDVFGEWQFVERFAHEPAQAHDRFATNQDVKTELAL